MTLRDLKPGQEGTVISIGEKGPMRRRIMDMGVTPGILIKVIKVAPLGDPVEVNVRGYELSLRKAEAENILVKQSN
jgi:ferrous iron transport protein A